jgi:hypothetical protein
LRRYLYQAALTAIRFDPELGAWYAQLHARGKSCQSARCAVAHKLLRRLMGRLLAFRAAQQEVLMPLAA